MELIVKPCMVFRQCLYNEAARRVRGTRRAGRRCKLSGLLEVPPEERSQLIRRLAVAGELVLGNLGPVELRGRVPADQQDERGRSRPQVGEVQHHPTGVQPERHVADLLVLAVVEHDGRGHRATLGLLQEAHQLQGTVDHEVLWHRVGDLDRGIFGGAGGDQGDARTADAEREDGITGEERHRHGIPLEVAPL